MSSSDGRRRRMLRPSLFQLESRRLLTVGVAWDGQGGVDLAGPTASVGPDGVQDVDLHLTNLSTLNNPIVQSIVVQGPAGFEWEYNNGATPDGWANAEFFRSQSDPSQGDLYINPTIDSNLNSSNQALGSSTGSPVTLITGNNLNVTVTYQRSDGSTFTDTGPGTVGSLAWIPKEAKPANKMSRLN